MPVVMLGPVLASLQRELEPMRKQTQHKCRISIRRDEFSRWKWGCNFKGLSHDRGGTDFSENPRDSLFIDDLSNLLSARSI